MRLFLGVALAWAAVMPASAQERCASTTPPAGGPATMLQSTETASPSATLTVPVVVHILWRTPAEDIADDQVRSQIESLNADFARGNADFFRVPAVFAARAASTGIRFVLATTDPDGRPTTGIVRKRTSAQLWINDDRIKSARTGGSDPWDTHAYLNIWVGNLSPSLLGVATFPGTPADRDGIVIRHNAFGTRGTATAPWDKGRTLTHEVGHWLGLRHLWGDTPCGDDGIDDTPRQKTGNRGNPSFPLLRNECANGPDGDMFMNFMDLSDDAALLMFTRGQAAFMRTQLTTARKGILSSKGAGEPWNLTPVPSPALVRFHPNPAREHIRIEGIRPDTPVEIYNGHGQLLLRKRMGEGRLDLPNLPAGIYRLQAGGETLPLVVQ